MHHRKVKTDAMLVIFKAAADDKGVFNFDTETVGVELGITKRAVEDLVSTLIGVGVIDRRYRRDGARLLWDYRFTGKTHDRRHVVPQRVVVTPAQPFGDPPAGRSVLDQRKAKAEAAAA
jgi:hypothetical protein